MTDISAAHARYGGSTMSRTIQCTAWRNFCDDLPKPVSTNYAATGTLLHLAMGRLLTSARLQLSIDESRVDVIGLCYDGHFLTDELYNEKIIPCYKSLCTIFSDFKVFDCVGEAKVTLADGVWGTADVIARGVNDDGEDIALCIDFKFGDGILVSPIKNTQLLFYALAASKTRATAKFFHGVSRLALAIIQPTAKTNSTYIIHETALSDLLDFEAVAVSAIERAESSESTFKAGAACDFCPGRGLCPATKKSMQSIERLDVKNPTIANQLPTFEELELVSKNIAALKQLIHNQLELGAEISGYKLVNKRGKRVYTDTAAVVSRASDFFTTDDIYKKELKSPPQLEKLCKSAGVDFDEFFNEFVTKKSSGTTLASADDPRYDASTASLETLTKLLTN